MKNLGTYLKLDYTHFCSFSAHEEEKFGHWEENYEFCGIKYASIGTKKDFDVISFENIQKGDTVYIIYALWSSGDSFGYATNSNIEFLYATKNEVIAEEIKNRVDTYTVDTFAVDDFELSDGNVIRIPHYSWNGYFESLSCCGIEKVEIS